MTAHDSATLEALRATPIAASLSPEQSEVLAGLVSLRTCEPATVLGQEGEVDDRLIAHRRRRARRRQAPRHAGRNPAVIALRAGDLAHELGFLDGTPRYASLVATEPTRVLELTRDALESLIDAHPRILYAVMCAIVRAVHRVQTRLSVQAVGADELRRQATRPVLTRCRRASLTEGRTDGSCGYQPADAAGVRRLRLAGLAQARHRARACSPKRAGTSPGSACAASLVNGLLQQRMVRREWRPGLMHAVIFLGFMSLLLRKLQLIAIGYDESAAFPGARRRPLRGVQGCDRAGRPRGRAATRFYRRFVLKPRAPRAQPRSAARARR